MDLNQQVAIANAVMRIVCGDSRSYYVGRPVEEMNPLIKATFDWGGKQGWSAEQIPQYFGDSFLAYFSGILGIRYRLRLFGCIVPTKKRMPITWILLYGL